MVELEGVAEALRGRTHIAEQALAFLCFLVFQTSDLSIHDLKPQYISCANVGSVLASYS